MTQNPTINKVPAPVGENVPRVDALERLAKTVGCRPAPSSRSRRESLVYALWFDGHLQARGILQADVALLDAKYGPRPSLRGRARTAAAFNQQVKNRK